MNTMKTLAASVAVIMALSPTSPVTAAAPRTQPETYSLARRVFPLRDGSRFVTYAILGPKGGAGALIYKHGQEKETASFTADQWIPDGASAPGDPGTIFAGDLSEDSKTLVVSYGWVDSYRHVTVNAIAVLRRDASGAWTHVRNIYFRGNVGDVVMAPGNLILATRQVFAAKGEESDPGLVVAVDTDGKVRGEYFKNPAGTNNKAGWRGTRLQRVEGGQSFALLDPFTETVRVFNIDNAAKIEVLREVSIAKKPEELAGFRSEDVDIRGFAVTSRGTVFVVRTGGRNETEQGVITAYVTRGGKQLTSKRVMNKWINVAFFEGSGLVGIYPEDGKPAFEGIQPTEP